MSRQFGTFRRRGEVAKTTLSSHIRIQREKISELRQAEPAGRRPRPGSALSTNQLTSWNLADEIAGYIGVA